MATYVNSPIRDAGPCVIDWDGGTVLDPIHGEVKITVEETLIDIFEEGLGVVPVDKIDVGTIVKIEVPFTRSTLAQMGDYMTGGTDTGTKLEVSSLVGGTRYDLAKELIIKPKINNAASATTTEWITFFKVTPQVNFEIPYSKENQRVFMVTFHCFPDDTSGNVGKVFRIGPA